MQKRIILGITGSFGSGKTTVARIFRSFGAAIIDADKIAHALLKPRTTCYKKIIKVFGGGVLKKNKSIDRNRLAEKVFKQKKLLLRLNRLTHPKIIKEIKKRIKKSPARLIVLDAPLLVESGLMRIIDKLIVVKITQAEQVRRIQKRTGLKKQEILKRIALQLPLRDKVRLADFVIDNSGTIARTKKQAERIRRLLWKN